MTNHELPLEGASQTPRVMQRIQTGFHNLLTGALFIGSNKDSENKSYDVNYFVMGYDVSNNRHVLNRLLPSLEGGMPQLYIMPMEDFDASYKIDKVLDKGNDYEKLGDKYILLHNPMDHVFEIYDGKASHMVTMELFNYATYQVETPAPYKNQTPEGRIQVLDKVIELVEDIHRQEQARAAAEIARMEAEQASDLVPAAEEPRTLSDNQLDQLFDILDAQDAEAKAAEAQA